MVFFSFSIPVLLTNVHVFKTIKPHAWQLSKWPLLSSPVYRGILEEENWTEPANSGSPGKWPYSGLGSERED